MGRQVLNATTNDASNKTRVYAHCTATTRYVVMINDPLSSVDIIQKVEKTHLNMTHSHELNE